MNVDDIAIVFAAPFLGWFAPTAAYLLACIGIVFGPIAAISACCWLTGYAILTGFLIRSHDLSR